MRARGLVDVLIPRGGASLIRTVVEESTVPVIETGVGNCHVYVDAAADLDMALAILLNAKAQRPSVCNAPRSLLVHADVADEFLPRALAALREAGVTVHGDAARWPPTAATWCRPPRRTAAPSTCRSTSPPPWSTRWTRRSRTSAGTARATPRRSSPRSPAAARRFVAAVDAAAVMVNASTRFTDGGEFGFGAEIGISTQKLHARGPMGLPELTSTKYVVTGEGHIQGEALTRILVPRPASRARRAASNRLGLQLRQDVADVVAHGLGGQAHLLGDLGVAAAVGQVLQHLVLTLGRSGKVVRVDRVVSFVRSPAATSQANTKWPTPTARIAAASSPGWALVMT